MWVHQLMWPYGERVHQFQMFDIRGQSGHKA